MTDAKAFIPPKIESFIFTAVFAVVSPPTLKEAMTHDESFFRIFTFSIVEYVAVVRAVYDALGGFSNQPIRIGLDPIRKVDL